MTQFPPEMIEAVARALCTVDGLNPDLDLAPPYRPNDIMQWRCYTTYTEAALRAAAPFFGELFAECAEDSALGPYEDDWASGANSAAISIRELIAENARKDGALREIVSTYDDSYSTGEKHIACVYLAKTALGEPK
jgi:hypothetical protein